MVFDVDDTLYLERDYVASGFAHVGEVVRNRFGTHSFGDVAWRLFLQGHRGDIFNRTLAELGIEAATEDVELLIRAYRNHRPTISLLPDAHRTFDDLRRLGIGIAVLTDGPYASQSAKVEALGLHRHARCIVLTDDYGPGYGKPHPRGFEQIAVTSGASKLAYVADNPLKDFEAPRRLGWVTVRVRRAGGLHVQLTHGDEVDRTVEDLDNLVGHLSSMGFEA